ncbi:MAG: PAS domain-containing protein, partial [Bacteroidota bacterium]
MYERSELERLRKEFEELQLRVTRFSSVEQELINMRDRLDHELDMYKRLHVFNNSALREVSGHEFVRLVADAIVDVFEVESAAVYLDRKEDLGGSLVYFEGMIFEGSSREMLVKDILSLAGISKKSKSKILSRKDLEEHPSFFDFKEGIHNHIRDEDSEFAIHMIGLNSIKNAPLYDIHNRSNLTIFDIFAQQVLSLQSNRQKRKRIGQQMLHIQASDRELKKLSLIATKTKNGVIITDNHGRIEWANDSFTNTSGWSLEEVKGKKPKDFLHGPNTDQAVVAQLSDALREKQNVEVAIMNYTKGGAPYFTLLEITPVF